MIRDQRARNVANATKTVDTTMLSRLYSCDHTGQEETEINRHQEGQPALALCSMSQRREYSIPQGEAWYLPSPILPFDERRLWAVPSTQSGFNLQYSGAIDLQHFTAELGRWLDCTDAARQFTTKILATRSRRFGGESAET